MFDGNGMPREKAAVRAASLADALQVAELHVAAINEGFLATLGPRFLRRLYARIVESAHGFLLVAVDPQEKGGTSVIGFVAGASSVSRLYREFVLKDGVVAGISSAPQLMRSIPRVVETLRYGAKDQDDESDGERAETELLSLAVAERARRRGAGALLVDAFRTEAARTGTSSARVVVGASNASAIRLYNQKGFVEARRLQLHTGTQSLLLRADLSDQWAP
jgi:ribosomal protein S18 acetylase RimI-like enzyme